MSTSGESSSRWADAAAAAAILAVDPQGIGGVSLRSMPGPVRDEWLSLLSQLHGESAIRRIPLHVTDGRLLGGLDLAATLRAGRPVVDRGLLCLANGGIILLAMAERLSAAEAARIAAVLDTGEVKLERDGFALRSACRLGVVALDEGMDSDERPPSTLLDRLALHVDLHGLRPTLTPELEFDAQALEVARNLLPRVTAGDDVVVALCETAWALGISSLRAPGLALRVARAAAALRGEAAVDTSDVELAARLVYASRAVTLPQVEQMSDESSQQEQPDSDAETQDSSDDVSPEPHDENSRSAAPNAPLKDVVLEAARAAIPTDLLTRIQYAQRQGRHLKSGRAGAKHASRMRGRPAGVARGDPVAGARLNVIETLRAAAPWQRIRKASGRIQVRRDDFRITRFKRRTRTTTIFVVDASGSAALHRLAEVKGAVELLLADCYVRRDQVAMLSFRGAASQLLLPPTRSLARAKRCLTSLPAGGGTPLATGIDAARALAAAARRQGETPLLVFMTDGRANVARNGAGGRAAAESDALNAARALQLDAVTTVLLDTAPQPRPITAQLAQRMGARYVFLPQADANALSGAVRAVVKQRGEGARNA